MLAILFLLVFGRMFYKLAEKHERNKWTYALIGGFILYTAIFIASFIIGIAMELINPGSIYRSSDFTINMLALPLGLLLTFATYLFIKRKLGKPKNNRIEDVIDTESFD